MNTTEIEKKINEIRGKKDLLLKQKADKLAKLEEISNDKEVIEESRVIIQTVAKATQKQLEYNISSIVTLALESVFEKGYSFVVDFVQKRGKTECDILIEKDGNRISPMDSNGGGLVDLVAFALRISLWSLKEKKTRNTIILDEPFVALSKDLQTKASLLIKTLSEKLGLQFIIVSHEETLIENADNVIEI